MKIAVVVLCMLLVAGECFAGEPLRPYLSLQGYSGLLNIPDAHVLEQGRVVAMTADQVEPRWRGLPNADERSYFLTLGLLPNVEFGGRLTEAMYPQGARDISASFKVQVPFIPKQLPQLAFGMQDVSGGASFFRTKYAVASYDLYNVSLSAGYGTGPDRLDGFFAGGEYRPADWLHLLAEHDTTDTNVGLRFVVTEKMLHLPVEAGVTVKRIVRSGAQGVDLGVMLSMPLGASHHDQEPRQVVAELPPEAEVAALPDDASLAKQASTALPAIKRTLIKKGFQNVRVGRQGDTLVLEYENSIFNHNDLDSFGVVLGIAARMAPEFRTFDLRLKKTDIEVFRLRGSLASFRRFMNDPSAKTALADSLTTSYGSSSDDDRSIVWEGRREAGTFLFPSLTIYPNIPTFMGTEVGVFDCVIEAKGNLSLQLWKGAAANVRYLQPVAWTSNYNNGREFGKYRQAAGVDQALLAQAWRPPIPGLMTLFSGGMLLRDNYGGMAEGAWFAPGGDHRFGVQWARFHDDKLDKDRSVVLGSYRWFYAPLDLSIKLTGGQFWEQDKGTMLEFRRWFGDTGVTLYYKNTLPTEGKRNQAAGILLTIPLTPRKDMSPMIAQVKGLNDWSYGTETSIAREGEGNYLTPGIALAPSGMQGIDRTYYNRDRLQDDYLQEHLLRLRDADATYNKDMSGAAPAAN